MPSYLELLKRLPKTNCKECGLESCLLFALKVSAGEWDISKCPYLPKEELAGRVEERITFNQLLENLKELKDKFKRLNLREVAYNLGARVEQNLAVLPYLDDEVLIELDANGYPLSLKSQKGFELDPRDEILLMNYFLYNGNKPLSQEFVGLESFPHSLSKVATLKRYAEEPLARLFDEKREAVLEALKSFKISQLRVSNSGVSFIVYALPRVPLMVNYWAGDPEEGLSSYCKVLYDASAISYLDLECLVFLAERLAEKL